MKPSSAILVAGLTALACAPPAFAAQADRGAEAVLYEFSRGNDTDGRYPTAGMIDVQGTLYGTTLYGGTNQYYQQNGGGGTLFSLDPSSGAEKVLLDFCSQYHCPDGLMPNPLIVANGTIYGTTELGGVSTAHDPDGLGAVFTFDPQTGAEKIIYAFPKSTDGHFPVAGVIMLRECFTARPKLVAIATSA